MEGPEGMTGGRYPGWNYILVFIVIIFHVVGFAGFSSPSTKELFLQIVPFHLLLMLLVVVLSHDRFSMKFIAFFALIFLAGFIIEWTGVHTGFIFGDYHYGATLGFKLFDIPLMIGVNWFLLIYATGVSMQRSIFKNTYSRIIIGAALLVILDALLEPIAIEFDQWDWAGYSIPFYNYICWFVVSVGMLYLFERFNFKRQGVVAPVFLITQFIFFLALHWI